MAFLMTAGSSGGASLRSSDSRKTLLCRTMLGGLLALIAPAAAAAGSPPTIASFTADPVLVAPGGTSTLSWSVSPTDAIVTLDGAAVGNPGSLTVNPAGTTSYTLTASNGGGSVSKTVTVHVDDGSAGFVGPSVTSPASKQSVSVSGVSFSWSALAGVQGYGIRIVRQSSGATVFSGSLAGLRSTSTLISLPDGGYTFLVRGCTIDFNPPNCGSYGSVSFTVSLTAPSPAPSVTSPTNGLILTSSTNTFTWSAVAGAQFYDVTIKNLSNGTTALHITVPSSSTSTVASLAGASYEITVKACQSACGPASTAVDFGVSVPAPPTTAPTITSASISGNQLTVSWSAVSGADLYQVQVVQPAPAGPGGGALTVASRQVSTTSATFEIPPGSAGIVVAACTGDGCGPNSSAASIVSSATAPSAPQVGFPMAGTVVQGPTTLITWSRVPTDDGAGNTTYRLFVQDLSRQATALDVFTTENFYAAYFNAEGSRYDALVIADPTGTPIQGSTSGFQVAGASSDAPTMVAPAHQSTVSAGNIQLGWSPVAGATLYEYFVAVQGQPTATVRGVTTGPFVQVPLTVPATYSAIVRACPAGATCAEGSDAGWGPFSNVAGPGVTSFTVVASGRAVLLQPADGDRDVNPGQPFRWTSVPGALTYFLCVGTALGGCDLASTGEVQGTSYTPPYLPVGQTLNARIYTLLWSGWQHSDISFMVGDPRAYWLYPGDGAVDVNPGQPLRWSSVPGALAYALCVGTASGRCDLVDSGEIQSTSYAAPALPAGRLLYARVYTKLASGWRYTEISFVAGVAHAYWLHPTDGAENVSPAEPLRWGGVPGALAYSLCVGTASGTCDVVDTGEIDTTSWVVPALPAGRTLYGRIYTLLPGGWLYSEARFTTSPAVRARFIHPLDGSMGVSLDTPFQWTAVAGANAYRLQVGTTPGGSDVLDSGDLLDTAYTAQQAVFLSPAYGATTVDPQFRWTSVPGALAYDLYVGTSRGAYDLVNTGEVQATSYDAHGLPSGQTLYARIFTKLPSGWRYSDLAFGGSSDSTLYARIWSRSGAWWLYTDVDADVAFTQLADFGPSRILVPADGSTDFDADNTFEWTEVPLARGYRLEIGTQPGTNDLHDSGEVTVTRRLVPNLPVGPVLYGRLSTRVGDTWRSTSFTFTAASAAVTSDAQMAASLWAAGFVRGMADLSNRPLGWTRLWDRVDAAGGSLAFCGDYAEVLLPVLREVNVTADARRRQILFYPNSYDGHILDAVRDDAGRWVSIDPTFALAMKRTSDAAWATAEDISQATRSHAFADLTYIPARPEGTFYAEGYYIDYPLLFLDLDYQLLAPSVPYLAEVPLPVDGGGSRGIYMLQCASSTNAVFLLDGNPATLSCVGPEHLTKAFAAGSIAAIDGGSDIRAYQVPLFGQAR